MKITSRRWMAVLVILSLFAVTPVFLTSAVAAEKKAETKKTVKKEVVYVASKEGGKYHTPTCGIAGNIKPENKISFASKAEAEKAGYQPCGVCKP